MARLDIRLARISTVPFFVVTQLKRQIEDIAAAGADITVITASGPELENLEWTGRVRQRIVEISRRFNPVSDFMALVRLIQLFRRERFDIVHSTTPKAGLLASLAGCLSGVPIRLHTFTGQTWITLSGPMYHIARGADWVIGRLATRCYADSASQRQFLIEKGVVRPERIEVLGGGSLAGIDTARFDSRRFSPEQQSATRSEIGLAPDSAVVLFVGRICEDKGVGELLEAFGQLRTGGRNVDLLLVGPFDERQDSLPREAVLSHLGVHHVDFTRVPEKYMAIADLLALPSYREGFGTVVIEAAAMGVPTVGTRIYGLSDAVVDGETGLLVPVRDAAALAAALAALLDDRPRREAMAEAGRERCLTTFDSKVVSTQVVAEYHRLVEKR